MSELPECPDMPEDEAPHLNMVDQAITTMVASCLIMEEHLPDVEAETDKEKAAVKELIDLLETGVTPYLGDMVKLMDETFGGESEEGTED